MKFKGIEWLLRRSFKAYSRILCRFPLFFIFVTLFITIGLGTGILYLEFENDTEYLFAPTESRARNDRMILEKLFPVDDLNTLPNRLIYITHRSVSIAITSKDGGNILRQEYILAVLDLDETVRNAEIYSTGNSTPLNFQNLCNQWNGNCFPNPVIVSLDQLHNESSPVIELPFPSITTPSGASYLIEPFFGGRRVKENKLVTADAILITYYLQSSPDDVDKLSKEWERMISNYLESSKYELIEVYGYTSQSLDEAQTNLAIGAIPFLVGAFVILVTFSSVSCIMIRDGVQSKPWIGVFGVMSVLLAVVSAVGLLGYCGIPFNNVIISMPFIILGIGLDDMFIMLAAWRTTDSSLSTRERMSKTLEDAGVSITITSLTDLLAFCIGSISPLPVIKSFCLYTGVAVLFDFFYQITFFGAFMVLFGYMESFNCHGVTCIPVPRSVQEDGRLNSISSNYSNGHMTQVANGHMTQVETIPDANLPRDKTVQKHAMMVFFRDYYPKIISKPVTLAVGFALYICYIGTSGYLFTTLDMGVEQRSIAEEGTMTFHYLNLFSEYFEETGPSISVVFTEPYPYWELEKQKAIETVLIDIHANRHVKHRNNTEFWLDEYIDYLHIIYGTSEIDQDTFVNILRDQFLNLPCCQKFRLDINFNGSDITSSRLIVVSRDTMSSQDEKKLLLDIRESVHKATNTLGIPVIASSPGFVFAERYTIIVPTTFLTLGIAMVSMLLVFLIVIPNIPVGLLVTLSVASILLGVMGFMAAWNIALGPISMVNLVLCIGFSVDFSAHIVYAFVMTTKESDISISEKLSRALYLLGYPILQSGLSTICAVILLFWSKSDIFKTFAKIITLVMGFGMLHGLYFLPIMVTILSHLRKYLLG